MYRITFPLSVHKGSLFSTSSPILIISCLFDDGHSVCVSWCLTVALICVSLMISDAKHLSYACLPFICLLWGKKKKMSIQFLFSDISSVRPYLIFASLHHFVPNNIVCYFLLMIPWFLAFLLFQAIPGLSEKEKAGKLTLVLFSLLSIIE